MLDVGYWMLNVGYWNDWIAYLIELGNLLYMLHSTWSCVYTLSCTVTIHTEVRPVTVHCFVGRYGLQTFFWVSSSNSARLVRTSLPWTLSNRCCRLEASRMLLRILSRVSGACHAGGNSPEQDIEKKTPYA